MSNKDPKGYYAILQIEPTASAAEIKKAQDEAKAAKDEIKAVAQAKATAEAKAAAPAANSKTVHNPVCNTRKHAIKASPAAIRPPFASPVRRWPTAGCSW